MPAPDASCTVRPGRAADRARIAAFQAALAFDTEGKRLDPERLDAGVAAVLADPARGRYLVAERDGVVVGSLLLTTEWSDWRDGWFLWIQSVFTAPEARRTGVYRALYACVMAEARARPDVCGVRLYVESENVRAQAVYEALGMQRSSYRFYEVDCAGADERGIGGQDPAARSSVGGTETAP